MNSLSWLQILVTPHVSTLTFRFEMFILFSFFSPVMLLEPGNEALQSCDEDEDEEIMGLDVIQNLRNTQEAGNRGEDWEEVRDSPLFF